MVSHDVRILRRSGEAPRPASARAARPRWALALVAGLCLACWSWPVPGAGAQDFPTLVGNTGQATEAGSTPVFALQSIAAQFGTGEAGGPWTLRAIRLELNNWQAGMVPSVSLHAASGELPGARIAALANPAPGAGSKSFAAPDGVTLQPDTAYTVVIESGGLAFNGFSLLNTRSTAEDDGGVAGWWIADARLIRQGGAWSVSTSGLKLKMAVLGAAESGDAMLSALALADGEGNAIDLDPAFAPGTTDYSAAVAHSVRALTVTATPTDGAATTSIANDDDASTPGSAVLDLAVGETAIAVTVTAGDGTADTYTVTVTRADPPPTGPSGAPRALVANDGQPTADSATPIFAFQSVATQFTTGETAGHWTLTAIRLEVRSWQSGVTPTVSLHGVSGNLPGARIATLSNPSPGTGSQSFAAPAGVTLRPSTGYMVVIESQGRSFSGFSLFNTESAAEDDGGATGWQIADTPLFRQGSAWRPATTDLKLKLAVLGRAVSGDATLGALTLADGGGNPIGLDPAFAAGTASYTASVAHSVSALTVTATAADSGATVSIAGDDDASTPGSAALALEVGENAVTVTVTAEDAATRGTYTVRVARAAAPPAPAPVPEALVGNTGQPVWGALEVHRGQRRAGIKFTSGGSAPGWTNAAIRLDVAAWHPGVTPVVKLRRVSGPWPGKTLATLTNPAPGTGSKRFAAPPGLILRPDTKYAVVVATGTRPGKFSLGITGSNDEDSGGAAGWSIADASRLDLAGAWSWRPQALMLAVEGAPIPDGATPGGLTGWFASRPAEHDGSAAFTVLVAFSDPIQATRNEMRNRAIQASGGRVTSAKRVEGSGDLWQVGVAPAGFGPVTLTVEGGRACGETGAVCTADGLALAETMALTVPGPLALSVSDASAREGVNSHAIFSINLNRPSTRIVTVNYATVDRSARVDEDYYERSGTATFTPGLLRFWLSVPVLGDAVDEGVETFALTLSNASGAAIADGEGTGTIVNGGPLPRAWISRFGRTVATQAVEAIGGRLRGGEDSRVVLGGVALGAAGQGVRHDDGRPQTGFARSMSARELLLGSSFRLAGTEEEGSPAWAAWGRVSLSGFGAEDGELGLDGEVTTGFVGLDFARGRWLAGIAASRSEGEGRFEPAGGGMTGDEGEIESDLTGVFPYARYRLGERLDIWGLAGYGRGDLALTRKRARDAVTETGLSMRMGAIGARGEVLSPGEAGGLALAVKSDVFWVRMKSEPVGTANSRRMEGSAGDASRLRLALRGSRAFEIERGSLFTPSAEIGIRHDGGDAERGAGLELGAGLRFAGPGFAVDGAVSTLAVHEKRDFEQWGASGSVRLAPGAGGRGLSLALAPAWGAASGGAERLWSLANPRDLAPDEGFRGRWRLETEIGYGHEISETYGVLTPYAGLSLADGGGRGYRAGAGWTIRPGTALRLQAVRDAGIGGYSVKLRARARW